MFQFNVLTSFESTDKNLNTGSLSEVSKILTKRLPSFSILSVKHRIQGSIHQKSRRSMLNYLLTVDIDGDTTPDIRDIDGVVSDIQDIVNIPSEAWDEVKVLQNKVTN